MMLDFSRWNRYKKEKEHFDAFATYIKLRGWIIEENYRDEDSLNYLIIMGAKLLRLKVMFSKKRGLIGYYVPHYGKEGLSLSFDRGMLMNLALLL